jgi:hypothetical protein
LTCLCQVCKGQLQIIQFDRDFLAIKLSQLELGLDILILNVHRPNQRCQIGKNILKSLLSFGKQLTERLIAHALKKCIDDLVDGAYPLMLDRQLQLSLILRLEQLLVSFFFLLQTLLKIGSLIFQPGSVDLVFFLKTGEFRSEQVFS